jgi:hypothetical protein
MTFFDPHLFQLKTLVGDSDPESAKYLDLDLDSAKWPDRILLPRSGSGFSKMSRSGFRKMSAPVPDLAKCLDPDSEKKCVERDLDFSEMPWFGFGFLVSLNPKN